MLVRKHTHERCSLRGEWIGTFVVRIELQQLVSHFGAAYGSQQGAQCTNVLELASRRTGNDEEEMDRKAILCIVGDPTLGEPESYLNMRETSNLPVSDGDPVSDSGRLDCFTVVDCPTKPMYVGQTLEDGTLVDDFVDCFGLRSGNQVADHRIKIE